MELEQLRQFVAVAEEATLSKAAETLHMSQPALSRAMQKLERDLGVPLFDRENHLLKLNKAGVVALEEARSVLASEQHFRDVLDDFKNKQRALRVGTCAPAPLWLLTGLILEKYPDAIVSSETLTEQQLERRLLAETLDFAILTRPLPLPTTISFLLMRENLLVVVPHDHPLRDRGQISFADVAHETFLVYSGIGMWWDMCTRYLPEARLITQDEPMVFQKQSLTTPHLTFSTDSALTENPPQDRVAIPLVDAEAHIEFYLASLNTGNTRVEDYRRWIKSRVLGDIA